MDINRVRWSGLIIALAGAAFTVVHQMGTEEGSPEGWWASFGFAVPWIAVGWVVLHTVNRWRDEQRMRGRIPTPPPTHWWLAAGAVTMLISVISIACFPLVLPGGVLVVAGLRAGISPQRVVVPLMLGALMIGAFAYLVLHEDPAEWTTDEGSAASSNIVTNTEATISVGAAALFAATAWTEPKLARPINLEREA